VAVVGRGPVANTVEEPAVDVEAVARLGVAAADFAVRRAEVGVAGVADSETAGGALGAEWEADDEGWDEVLYMLSSVQDEGERLEWEWEWAREAGRERRSEGGLL
jgi:hypothetical protein